MFVSVKNNSPAKQGVHTLDGVRWIKPGATVTIEIDELRQLERLPFLEITHLTEDGVPVGNLPAPPASLLDKMRGEPVTGAPVAPAAVDDIKALRAEYQDKLGKRPFTGWGAEELRRRMAAA